MVGRKRPASVLSLSLPEPSSNQGIRHLVGFSLQDPLGLRFRPITVMEDCLCIWKLGSAACFANLSLPSESFQALGALVGGTTVFPTVGILDAHTIDFLGDSHSSMYGSICLWATVSWGTGSVVMDYLTDCFGSVPGTLQLLARGKSEQDHCDSGKALRWNVLLRALNLRQMLLWMAGRNVSHGCCNFSGWQFLVWLDGQHSSVWTHRGGSLSFFWRYQSLLVQSLF